MAGCTESLAEQRVRTGHFMFLLLFISFFQLLFMSFSGSRCCHIHKHTQYGLNQHARGLDGSCCVSDDTVPTSASPRVNVMMNGVHLDT